MIQIERDVPLGPLTTFRIGGPARHFAEIRTEPELAEALDFAEAKSVPIFALGGGSNLLIPDCGFAGLVLHMVLTGPMKGGANQLEVPAGMNWDALVRHVCEMGLSGMECLAGIPGLVGASPIQNIGAYGQEVAQAILSVRAYDRQSRRFTTLLREDCGFAYRESIFNTSQRNRYLITSVTFVFDADAKPNLTYPDLRNHFVANRDPDPLEVYEAVRTIRRTKGMILLADGDEGVEDTRSGGSFFKNPVVPLSSLTRVAEALDLPEERIPRYPASDGQVKLPAAWLLDRAGFPRGFIDGEAGISTRHTLALINRGGASQTDIVRLRDRIRDAVQSRFHIALEQEPVEP